MFFTDMIKAVNGHLDKDQALAYAADVKNDNFSAWTTMLPEGISASYARGKVAQRLITNPALPDSEVNGLRPFADDPAVQNRTVIKNGQTQQEAATDYMAARKARVEYYKAKYGQAAS